MEKIISETPDGERKSDIYKNKETRAKIILNSFLILVTIFILILIYRSCNSSSESSSKEDMSSSAYIISQDFVKQKLKSPSTADFPYLDYQSDCIADNTWKVLSYVDSENIFGANIRTYFKVTLKYNGGEWTEKNNWTLISIQLE